MTNWKRATPRKIVRKIGTIMYECVRNPVMARDGLHPSGTAVISTSGQRWDVKDRPPVIKLPNLSGHYHSVTRGFWDFYGLGDKCLLVSENNKVKAVMSELYPETSFMTTDYFTELQVDKTDIIWDVCQSPPPQLQELAFSSIIASALLEHLIDPTTALANMLRLLRPGGHLYAHTHTPSFPLHRYPRDYVRFHQDYFEDLPNFMRKLWGLEVRLAELWSRRGHIITCYEKTL
jgi:hypothetical protein